MESLEFDNISHERPATRVSFSKKIKKNCVTCGLKILNRLEENDYKLYYCLMAYLMYAGWFSLIGIICSIIDHNIIDFIILWFIGSVIGVYVSFEVYFKRN